MKVETNEMFWPHISRKIYFILMPLALEFRKHEAYISGMPAEGGFAEKKNQTQNQTTKSVRIWEREKEREKITMKMFWEYFRVFM